MHIEFFPKGTQAVIEELSAEEVLDQVVPRIIKYNILLFKFYNMNKYTAQERNSPSNCTAHGP